MSDATDDFTLRPMFNTGVSEDQVNHLILQSERVSKDDVWRIRDLAATTVDWAWA